MQQAKNQFQENIQRIRELDAVYVHLTENQALGVDLSDLLRAEIVYAVSALDKLVHELVRMGMLEIFEGNRLVTPAYSAFSLSNKVMQEIIEATTQDMKSYWFQSHIIAVNKANSFQKPENITKALSLFWKEDHKWQKIATEMGMDERTLKNTLKEIVTARDLIVHEADIILDPQSLSQEKQERRHNDTQENVNFIELLGLAIIRVVNS
jgi:hypothetical protein